MCKRNEHKNNAADRRITRKTDYYSDWLLPLFAIQLIFGQEYSELYDEIHSCYTPVLVYNTTYEPGILFTVHTFLDFLHYCHGWEHVYHAFFCLLQLVPSHLIVLYVGVFFLFSFTRCDSYYSSKISYAVCSVRIYMVAVAIAPKLRYRQQPQNEEWIHNGETWVCIPMRVWKVILPNKISNIVFIFYTSSINGNCVPYFTR